MRTAGILLALVLAVPVATPKCDAAEAPRPAASKTAASPKPSRDCPRCPEMIRIPAGRFSMGSDPKTADVDPSQANEMPAHEVEVKAFWIGKYEVTFAEWDACVRAKACKPVEDEKWGHGRRPVIYENWDEANAYAAWLSRKTGKKYRLPTEAEWEYAARAGSTTLFPWGMEIPEGAAICWSGCGPEADRTAPVGSTHPNAFGLYDMHGNVWEWVLDCWNASYAGAPADGSAWQTGDCEQRVIRGGSWRSTDIDLRSTVRAPQPHTIRYSMLGLRVVREP